MFGQSERGKFCATSGASGPEGDLEKMVWSVALTLPGSRIGRRPKEFHPLDLLLSVT